MGLQIEELKGKRASESVLALISGQDRRTVKKQLEESDMQFTEGPKNGKEYDILTAIHALIRASKGQNSADRRNDAQARKLELECGILEGIYILISRVVAPIRAYLGATSREIQDSNLEEEAKQRLIEKLKDTLKEISDLSGEEIEEL